MEDTLSNLETYGYIALFLYSFGGGFVGIVAASVLAGIGKLDLWLSIVIASLGNAVGSTILAYLARFQKQDFKKYLAKHTRKLALAHLWIKRYGAVLFFVNKFIYGFKTILPLAVGLSKYPLKVFAIYNLIACFIWGVGIGLAGFYASSFVVRLFEKWQQYPYVMPLVFLGLGGGIYLALKIRSKK